MALDGFPSIRWFWFRLRAARRFLVENDQWWKTLGHYRLSTYNLERGLAHNLMFSIKFKTRTWHHKTEREKAIEMIVARKPLDTTNGHCQKLPLKTTTLPPKGESGHCMMSRKVQSIASAQCQCCARTSSQMINFASQSSSAKSLCTSIEHIESLPMAIGL
jgi:hypothetical protein